jgi:hypothetical protein
MISGNTVNSPFEGGMGMFLGSHPWKFCLPNLRGSAILSAHLCEKFLFSFFPQILQMMQKIHTFRSAGKIKVLFLTHIYSYENKPFQTFYGIELYGSDTYCFFLCPEG